MFNKADTTTYDVIERHLPGSPRCRKVRPWTVLRARLSGRRDASGPPPDTAGHFPFTRQLHTQTAEAESLIGAVLHTHVERLDATIAGHLAARQTAQALIESQEARRSTLLRTTGPRTPAGVAALREAGALERVNTQMRTQNDRAAQQVHELLSTRRHIIDLARALLDAHCSRYNLLAAAHRRGWQRRVARRDPELAIVHALPAYEPKQDWTTGQLPLLTVTLQPDLVTTLSGFPNPVEADPKLKTTGPVRPGHATRS